MVSECVCVSVTLCVYSIERDQETHCHDATEWSYDKLQQAKDTSPCHRTAALEPISSPEPSLTPTSPPPPVASSSSLSQPADFAVVDMLLEMGFMRTIVNAAMRRCVTSSSSFLYRYPLLSRCEVPDGVQTRQRMDLLINWILEHPEAAIEDTTPPTVLEEPLVIHEAAQTMAANELLSVLGEVSVMREPLLGVCEPVCEPLLGVCEPVCVCVSLCVCV